MPDTSRRIAPVPRLSLNIEETGQAVSLCAKTVAKLISEGRLKAVRVDTRRLIPVAEIERWLTSEAEAAGSTDPAGSAAEPADADQKRGRAANERPA